MSPKIVDWKAVNTSPDNTFKRTENCNYVIKLCQKIGLQLKGICGKDIEEGRENLTLSLLGQLMRFDIFNLLNNLKYNGVEVTETTLIEWANVKVIVSQNFPANFLLGC
jgi:plastin-1